MCVTLRTVRASDGEAIRTWARCVADEMSRTHPLDEAADRHDPAAGLFWYIIMVDGRAVGTVWIELPAEEPTGHDPPEAVLGIFLGDPADRARGIGTAAVRLATAEFQRAHPHLPVGLRVRLANAGAIACYRRAGFAITDEGAKTLCSGEVVPFYRMTLEERSPE